MTELIQVDPVQPDPLKIARAARCLKDGGLVAFPTETVYGLGVHAMNRAAVQRLFLAKGRPANDPLIVHIATLADAAPLVVELPQHAARLAEAFWPGPLTLVMRRAPSVPVEVTAGLDTVAIRVPGHPVALALLRAAAVPVAAPSANLFSRPSPTRAQHVLEDLDGRIDMLIDGGTTRVGVESTVLDLTVNPPVVLRAGAVAVETLRAVVPDALIIRTDNSIDTNAPMPSPGLLSRHYAPRAPVTLYRGHPTDVVRAIRNVASESIATGKRVGVLVTDLDKAALQGIPVVVASLGRADHADTVAATLYSALRELDAAHVDIVLARDVGRDDGLWLAVRDRLRRAAASVVDVPAAG